MYLELTFRGQSHVRIHLRLSFLLYPSPVLRTQLGLEQLKPQLLLSLLQFPEFRQLCFEAGGCASPGLEPVGFCNLLAD